MDEPVSPKCVQSGRFGLPLTKKIVHHISFHHVQSSPPRVLESKLCYSKMFDITLKTCFSGPQDQLTVRNYAASKTDDNDFDFDEDDDMTRSIHTIDSMLKDYYDKCEFLF